MESVSVNNIVEMQKAADYYSMKNSVKGKATPNIIWGVLNIIWGLIATVAMSPINAILVLIGFFLLCIGVWSRVKQTPTHLLFAGIALIILAAWNIVISIMNIGITIASGGSYFGPIGIIWAVWQLALGIDAFNKYRRYAVISPQNPGEEMLRKIDQITKPVINANTKTATDIIQFNKPGMWSASIWKGKLFTVGTCSIITSQNRNDIFFVQPEDVQISQTGKFRKLLKATFNFRGFKFNGTIDPTYFERYEAWKKASSSPVK
jgi:hypothetical protein